MKLYLADLCAGGVPSSVGHFCSVFKSRPYSLSAAVAPGTYAVYSVFVEIEIGQKKRSSKSELRN